MSFADWWSRRTVTACPQCGTPGSVLARSCPRCGARKRLSDLAGIAAVAALAVLLAAGIAAWLVRGPPPAPDDFAWLTKAMEDCDAEAALQPSTVYFLVVPITSKPEDQQQWQAQSLNDVGNAILLSSEDAVEGLRRGALKIAAENYDFNVRDGANVLYTWTSSNGIARLTIPNASAIEGFNIQFQTPSRTAGTAWGTAFIRRPGTCNWVNAIIGN